ncbi:MAG TPA: hypothetical protein PKA63_00960 [Oligoflexia bacterium]|nr:hypothetical protein [Oligoflexia bacterium]HMP47218.1 hypothetical protein [Oligoflexia bacterium]
MIRSRELKQDEQEILGTFGRVHDDTEVPWGERTGILLVHGRAGDEKVMWVFSKAIENIKGIILSPRAIIPDPIGGFSWWLLPGVTSIESSSENKYQEISINHASSPSAKNSFKPGVETILRASEMLVTNYGVHPDKRIAIGFSQGAALVGSASLMNPCIFAKVVLLAGFIPEVVLAEFQFNSIDIMPEYFISHGTEDQVVAFNRAVLCRDYLIQKGARVTFHSDKVGHKISASGIKALSEWFHQT